MRVKPRAALNWGKILVEISEDRTVEVRRIIEENYLDVVTTNWPVVEGAPEPSGNRVLRFKLDPMTRWIVDCVFGKNGAPGLNEMCVACQSGAFGKWDRRRIEDFYRGMGYSLCGFAEVFRSGDSNWRTR